MSTAKDFEVPLSENVRSRLERTATAEGQPATALARSLIIEGLRAREQHEMELAKYQSETTTPENRPRGNTPQKTR